MSGYRFATAAQFDACLFDRADRGARGAAGLRPFAPFSHSPTLYGGAAGFSQPDPDGGLKPAAPHAYAPAVTRTGELLWRDDDGLLHRLPACADEPESFKAPLAIAQAERIIATPRGLWAVSGSSIELYEEETLARLWSGGLQPAGDDEIVDIAGDGNDGVWALVQRADKWHAIHVDCIGRIAGEVAFERISQPTAFVFLRRAKRFVVLARNLYWFAEDGGPPLFNVVPASQRPCFTARILGSDANSRVFAAGADDQSFGGKPYVLSFDGDGNPLDQIPLDVPATGVVATRDTLIVTTARGALRFKTADVVPDGAGEVRSSLITPMLHSPDREDARRWLRIEASAGLPAGAAIEISYAATDKPEVRDRLAAIFADESLTATQRMRKLRSEPDVWKTPIVLSGAAGFSPPAPDGGLKPAAPLAAPLFDVREPYLWVSIALSAAAGSRLPEVTELNVLYPGRTLMENLPAIYQRSEAQQGSFLRGLVGVLETTTQELDAHIASMGSRIHPSTASDEWLDFTARWLGLPWDDALTSPQKKAIMQRAPDIAKGRGTRAGLEALLESLVPGTPRRFRVTDHTADFGFATVGGDGCAGSALPAMLGGSTRWHAELGRAVLGSMRLPCANDPDDGVWQLAGTIRIEIAATAEERKAWEPWLLAVITEMVPLTARIDLRWIGPKALRSDRLGSPIELEGPPAPHLGTGTVTGLARLPDRGARLSSAGPNIGTRLR